MNVEIVNDEIYVSDNCCVKIIVGTTCGEIYIHWIIVKDGNQIGYDYDVLDYTLQEVVDRALYLV